MQNKVKLKELRLNQIRSANRLIDKIHKTGKSFETQSYVLLKDSRMKRIQTTLRVKNSKLLHELLLCHSQEAFTFM